MNIKLYFIHLDYDKPKDPYYFVCVDQVVYEDFIIHGVNKDGEEVHYFEGHTFFHELHEALAFITDRNAELRSYSGNNLAELYDCAVYNYTMIEGIAPADCNAVGDEMMRLAPDWPWVVFEHHPVYCKDGGAFCSDCAGLNIPVCRYGLKYIGGEVVCLHHIFERNKAAEVIDSIAALLKDNKSA